MNILNQIEKVEQMGKKPLVCLFQRYKQKRRNNVS